MTYILAVSEVGVSALEKAGNKLFFDIREAKVKVFRPSGSSGVDDANELLTKMQLEEPPQQTHNNDAEGRAD